MQANILERKIEKIEDEVSNLKSIVLELVQQPKQKGIIKLKGLLKNVKIEEKDIESAKKSLFNIGA